MFMDPSLVDRVELLHSTRALVHGLEFVDGLDEHVPRSSPEPSKATATILCLHGRLNTTCRHPEGILSKP